MLWFSQYVDFILLYSLLKIQIFKEYIFPCKDATCKHLPTAHLHVLIKTHFAMNI